jgi:hypothetical protein
MIVDFGSRLVQDWFKVKVQGETLEKSMKFKVVQGKHNLFYITFFNQCHQRLKKYKNNKYISIENTLNP